MMIDRFLMMFEAHREVCERCEELLDQVSKAERDLEIANDRTAAVISDRASLWSLVKDSIGGERAAYQMQINREWQGKGFGAPYPDAAKIQESAASMIGGGTAGREMPQRPSDRMARATRSVINEMISGINE